MENQNQATNTTSQPLTQTKSYTERFAELETQTEFLTRAYKEANDAFNVVATLVKELNSQVRMLNDQLQAVYDLSESKTEITRHAVASVLNKRRAERVQNILDTDEKNGLITKIEMTQTEDDIIAYTSDEVTLGFKAVANFKSDGIEPSELINKKAGDKVKNIQIKQIYRIVQSNQSATEQQGVQQ